MLRQTYAYLALNVYIDDVNVYSVIYYEKAIEKKTDFSTRHSTVRGKRKVSLKENAIFLERECSSSLLDNVIDYERKGREFGSHVLREASWINCIAETRPKMAKISPSTKHNFDGKLLRFLPIFFFSNEFH